LAVSSRMVLEREGELGVLAGLFEGVGSSGGRTVLIRGEAGIGKTALVREFIDRHSDRAHVLVGVCDDLLTARPLGPFWDMARDEPDLLVALEADDTSRVMGTVLDLVSRSLRPTIVLIEDTQWADEATLDAITYLGRRIEQANGLVVLTYRDGEVDFDHPLRGVIGGLPPASVVRIRLEGLSLSAVTTMLGGSGLAAEEVIAATDGNPFLVSEMASGDGEVVPSSVQDSVMSRVGKLSSEARELLRVLSVIPERVSRGEVSQLTGGADAELGECERRGLLEFGDEFLAFRHELIRRAVEASLTTSERMALNRTVLEVLPPGTDAARLVHHARRANDIPRLVELAPKAAAAAVAVGSHREARDHFRQLTGHLDRIDPALKGPILDQWAMEESILDNYGEAIRVNELALLHYRGRGDQRAESAALTFAAGYHEYAGQRSRAEQLASQAVDVLGADPDGHDLARALEVNGYLAMMAHDAPATLELVERTLEAAGPDVDERILIRSLNHRGCALSVLNYPEGRASLDEARRRAEAAGEWMEVGRALGNHADMALESRDLPAALDYVQRAIASFVRHEYPSNGYLEATYARVLELKGEWSEAEDLARDLHDYGHMAQIVAVPVLGVIEAREGRTIAQTTVTQGWEMAVVHDEYQYLVPAASALAEHAWIAGTVDIPVSDIKEVMETGLGKGLEWSAGSIALWLWKLSELTEAPEGIAEPYRLTIEGEPMAAVHQWAETWRPNCPTRSTRTTRYTGSDSRGRQTEAGTEIQGCFGSPSQEPKNRRPGRRSHRQTGRSPRTPGRAALQRRHCRPALPVTENG